MILFLNELNINDLNLLSQYSVQNSFDFFG
jgi:hypothetical protein